MKCDRCGEREGEVRYTEYVDGEMHRSRVCRTCAEELGFADEDRPEAGPPPAGQVLGVVKVEAILRGEEELPSDARNCPRCGSTADELDDHSLFGCPACYEAFETSLETLFRRVHGRVRHRGRIPGGFVEGPPEDPVDPVDPVEPEPGDSAESGGDVPPGDDPEVSG